MSYWLQGYGRLGSCSESLFCMSSRRIGILFSYCVLLVSGSRATAFLFRLAALKCQKAASSGTGAARSAARRAAQKESARVRGHALVGSDVVCFSGRTN
jgi:hypothetical protein